MLFGVQTAYLSQVGLAISNLSLFLCACSLPADLGVFSLSCSHKQPPPDNGVVMSAVCLLHLLSHIWCGKLGGAQMDHFPWVRSLLAKSTC